MNEFDLLIRVQEEHSHANAERSIDESQAKAEREAKKVQEHEEALTKEEKALEEIQESLKGIHPEEPYFSQLMVPLVDKTRSFHDQIEVKQKELQPWATEINKKQAAIDLAKSERETLVRKFEAVREAKEEAESTKNRLRGEKDAKVSIIPFFFGMGGTAAHRVIGSRTARSTPTQSWNGRRTRQTKTAFASMSVGCPR